MSFYLLQIVPYPNINKKTANRLIVGLAYRLGRIVCKMQGT